MTERAIPPAALVRPDVAYAVAIFADANGLLDAMPMVDPGFLSALPPRWSREELEADWAGLLANLHQDGDVKCNFALI